MPVTLVILQDCREERHSLQRGPLPVQGLQDVGPHGVVPGQPWVHDVVWEFHRHGRTISSNVTAISGARRDRRAVSHGPGGEVPGHSLDQHLDDVSGGQFRECIRHHLLGGAM
eukprot:4807505-Pyramimonas_sp.AAC.1